MRKHLIFMALLFAVLLTFCASALGEAPAAAQDASVLDGQEAARNSDPAFGQITLKEPSLSLLIGASANLKPIGSSKAIKKGYTYVSSDEGIAKVNKEGHVKAVSAGTCDILITSTGDTRVWVRYPVHVLTPVSKITVQAPETTLSVGGTLQLTTLIEPETASEKSVTWRSAENSIATVDQNGLVTGVKRGTCTISAISKDGTKVVGRIKLTLVQPVTGVSVDKPIVRVAVNSTTTVTAKLLPAGATNKEMTWISSDESIATVKGKKNEVRITGHRWGQCIVTGTTQDGGYSVDISVNAGALYSAASIVKPSRDKKGNPTFSIVNRSNLTLTNVTVAIRAYDYDGSPILLPNGNVAVARAVFRTTLAPGQSCGSSKMKFSKRYNFGDVFYYEVAVTGWSCVEGYQRLKGTIAYKYDPGERNYHWVVCADKRYR